MQVVQGRAMIAVAAGETPEEALALADDFPNAEVFDSLQQCFVPRALPASERAAHSDVSRF